MLSFSVIPGRWAIARLAPSDPVPGWVPGRGFASVTRTENELSIVCEESALPEGIEAERGWAMLRLTGPIPFSQVGVLAVCATALAHGAVPIFAISTYDTDTFLVPAARLEDAIAALAGAGIALNA